MKRFPGQSSLTLVLFYFICVRASAQTPAPSFNLPDTVCLNTQVKITNTSVGGTTFYWNFCQADLNETPEALNMGNIGNLLSTPVFLDIVSENGNYYGFLTNHNPGGLVRLDFGNSMLNTPTATNLGNFGGIINAGPGTEGIQMIKSNGKWYALIVGGDPISGGMPKIVQISFGASVANPSPVATDWGNLGNMDQSIGLYVFNEGNHWYGFTVNATNNSMTRFDFGTNLDNPPVALNMGNPGGFMQYPTGICAINDGGFWRVFIVSSQNNTLIRLDFGNSLLNTPVPINLGNPGNTFNAARDLRIIRSCDQVIGFVAGGANTNDLIKIDFHNDLTSAPTGVSLGNIGNFNFSHCLAKLFRVGADLYTFVPNAFNNTLTRVRFPGCNNASFPNSPLKDPPAITWSQPGTYRVNLIMDDGLETEASFCKTIVVLPAPVISTTNDTLICTGGSVQLLTTGAGNYTYSWSPANGLSDPNIANPLATPAASGYYYVTAVSAGGANACTTRDSVLIKLKPPDSFRIQPSPANVCKGDTIRLQAQGGTPDSRDSWRWLTPVGAQDPSSPAIDVSPPATTTYQVIGLDEICHTSGTANLLVNVLPLPAVVASKSNDIDCIIGESRLFASGAIRYSWYPAASLSDSSVSSPLASVDTTTRYYVEGKGTNGCTSKDSIVVYVNKNSPTNGYPVANAFTPNGDGHNDCFGIKYWGYIGNVEMAIYNRWGVRVFESKHRDACWDGAYHGQPQPAGTYIYIIKANTLCGNVVRKGTLELIR
ncbi:MAG TPA: gliding motility-associated C-terminal domain-containing protein [Puia sp.]